MLVHYKGILGEFDYDTEEFMLRQNYYQNYTEVLEYCGREVQGKNIHIPNGIIIGAFMFAGNQHLLTTPEIPDSITHTYCMFTKCSKLKKASHMGKKVVDANCMFYHCGRLESFNAKWSENLKDATQMFDGCSMLCEVTNALPDSIQFASSMFAGCTHLTNIPNHLPLYLKEANYMFANCWNLKKFFGNVKDYPNQCASAYMACNNIVLPYIPKDKNLQFKLVKLQVELRKKGEFVFNKTKIYYDDSTPSPKYFYPITIANTFWDSLSKLTLEEKFRLIYDYSLQMEQFKNESILHGELG